MTHQHHSNREQSLVSFDVERCKTQDVPAHLTIPAGKRVLFIEENFVGESGKHSTDIHAGQESALVYAWNVVSRENAERSFTLSLAAKATVLFYGIVLGRGRGRLQFHLQVLHEAEDAKSASVLRILLHDHSRFDAGAIIRVLKEAHRADAYFESRAILLGEHARVSVRPALEIEARDVLAKHAATTGPVDPEQLFYLTSRGFDGIAAQRAIVNGFVYDVLRKLPKEEARSLTIARWDHALAHSV